MELKVYFRVKREILTLIRLRKTASFSTAFMNAEGT